MAAAKPAAVAMSASAIPGATPPILADPFIPMARKECMMPQTVPNNPMKGVVLPVVAKKSNPADNRVISRLMALFRTRLMPFMSLDVSGSP